MALFTDGPLSTIDDLAGYDSQLGNVASTEGIDVTRKLALAQEEIGVEVERLLARLRPAWPGFTALPGLKNVAGTIPLKQWHRYRTLEMVYADAYNSQLNDRYAGRRDEFHQMARAARERLIESGIGMVRQPVPQAAAPAVAANAGNLPDGTYYVTMAWENASGAEGAAALPVSITLTSNSITVTPGAAPSAAAGWNVYVGTAPDAMQRQNTTPIGPQSAWAQPAALSTTGKAPGTGQAPDYFQPAPRLMQRG